MLRLKTARPSPVSASTYWAARARSKVPEQSGGIIQSTTKDTPAVSGCPCKFQRATNFSMLLFSLLGASQSGVARRPSSQRDGHSSGPWAVGSVRRAAWGLQRGCGNPVRPRAVTPLPTKLGSLKAGNSLRRWVWGSPLPESWADFQLARMATMWNQRCRNLGDSP